MRNKVKTKFKETEIGKIPEEWDLLSIDEIGEVVGGGTPSTKVQEFWDGDIAWLTPRDLSNYNFRYVSRGERNISRKGLEKSSAKILPPNSVLLTTRAPVGYVAIARNDISTNQGFRSVIPKKGVSFEYLYYLLKNNTYYLKSHASGTTFGELAGSTLKSLKFAFPNFDEQKSIAKILSDLDSKIELNIQMNKTLETIGQALFKHWFVDFEFPNDEGKPYRSSGGEMVESELGEMPKGWRICKLNELVTISKESCNPSKTPEDTFTYYSISAYDNGEIPVEELGKNILSNKFIVKDHSILLCKLNPRFPRCWALWDDNKKKSVSSTEFLVLIPEKVIHYSFIYRLLKSNYIQNSMQSHITGTSSSHQRVRPKDILELNITIPTEKILTKYHKATSKTLIKIDSNKIQNKSLSHIRDSLLPRLMSGRIRMV